jgi:hypothetical protein
MSHKPLLLAPYRLPLPHSLECISHCDAYCTCTIAQEENCGEGAKAYDGQSWDTYLATTINPSSNMFTVSFSFKTSADNEILIQCGQSGKYKSDHIVFEILGGQLHFDFAPGGGSCQINMHTPFKVNDGKWHTVTARRMSATTGSLRVDGVDTCE